MAQVRKFFKMQPKHVVYLDFGFGKHRHVFKNVIW